ncbi:chromatin modification-related protein [Rhodotorula toruloides]|uniref:Vacuolar import and degradation protein 21 n=1 Tax=Rhodotorula toruloides TaxID=5286 RepID=A0A511K819_RHOTO|nr:chromatin modification-related protein [Rhodotorula toruloides]
MARASQAADGRTEAEYMTLRSHAIQPKEARLAALAATREEQLADLLVAVQDKGRFAEFEAGLRGRKRRKLGDGADLGEGTIQRLEQLEQCFSDAKSLQQLDLSLPPLSPSPPPPSHTTTARPAVPATPAEPLPSSDVVNDSDQDAEGEEVEDEEMAVAEALAPPGVSVTTTGTSNGTAARAETDTAATTPQPQISLTAPSAPSSTAVSPSPAPSTSQQPATVSPYLLQATQQTYAATTPAAAGVARPPFVPVPPYTSLFGIEEISSDYASTLPPVPYDILRRRLNTALLLRSNNKKASKSTAPSSSSQLVQPDLYKLHVRAQHMGAKTFLGPGKRVHNALTTHEWQVGTDEMRYIRAFERIEQLKAERKWSFRQPKKQRTGVVPKAHWDHVLDEMRWMQIDFRQETRWKVVTAYKLARACHTYVRASEDDRPMLRVKVREPRRLSDEEVEAQLRGEMPDEDRMDVEAEQGDEVEDVKVEKTDKGKGKEREMSEDVDAVGEEDADGEADDAPPASGEDAAATSSSNSTTKSTAANPVVPVANAAPGAGKAGGSAVNEATPAPSTSGISRSQAQQLAAERADAQARHVQNLIAFRRPIFDAPHDDTVVDPLVLDALQEAAVEAASLPSDENPFLDYDFTNLFPDLPLYSDFTVASDPSLDRRVEDSSAWAGRLAHVTRLLESKPLLVATLEPSKTRVDKQHWAPGTGTFIEDIKEPIDPRETAPTSASALFAGRRPKDAVLGDVLQKPAELPNAELRATTLLWLPEEDAMLLALQKQYGFNWNLISHVFNVATHRPAPDRREAWDVYDRWDRLVGPGSKKTLPDGTEIVRPPPDWMPPVDKTGKPLPIIGDGSKKKARHAAIMEAMKRAQKKRELAASKQNSGGFPRRVNMGMHDSHNLPPRPTWSPMEWSVFRAEQDQQKIRLRQQQAAAQAAAQQQQQQRLQQQQQGPPGQQGRHPQLMAAQAAAHASPNGTLAALPGSPSTAHAQLGVNGTPPIQMQQLPNGQTPQLTPEQLQMLQQRQRELLQAQAQAAAAQQAARAAQQQVNGRAE